MANPSAKHASRDGVVPLSHGQRAVAYVAGVGTLSVGIFADFQDKDGGATVALIALGGISLLLAILGVVPKQITIGDNSVLLADEARKVADDAVAPLSMDETERVAADRVARATPEDPPLQQLVTGRIAEHVVFEREVVDAVTRAARAVGAEVRPATDGYHWDVEATRGDVRLLVEARLVLDVPSARKLDERARMATDDTCVLVVSRETKPGALEALTVGRQDIIHISGSAEEVERVTTEILTAST